MANIPGSVPVSGFIAPTSPTDVYPSHDAIWGKGGYRTVKNTVERDAIPDERRTEGMRVFVLDELKEYQLLGGIKNTDWSTPVNNVSQDYMIVQDKPERDAIPTDKRKVGLKVYVVSLDQEHRLIGGTANTNWEVQPVSGYRIVQNIAERDNIPASQRMDGLTVYVIDSLEEHRLVGGIDNSNWEVVPSGGSGGDLLSRKTVIIDADETEVEGKRYQTYAAAAAYINAHYSPNYYEPYFCILYSRLYENVVLEPYIFLVCDIPGTGAVDGLVTTGTSTAYMPYKMSNIAVKSVDPQGDAWLELDHVLIVEQQDTVGTGHIYMRNSTELWAVTKPDIDLSSWAEIYAANSWINQVRKAQKITMELGCNLEIRGNTPYIDELYADNGTTINLANITGHARFFMSNIKNTQIIGAAVNLDLGNGATALNTVFDGVTVHAIGAGFNTAGCTFYHGAKVIEAGGIWTNYGNTYDNRATGLTAEDMQSAIDELFTRIPTTNIEFVTHGQSIQEAIDRLEARGGLTDEVQAMVVIGPGFYEENIMMKSMIHLVSFTTGKNNYTATIKGEIIVNLQPLASVSGELRTSLIGLYMRSESGGIPGPTIRFTGSERQRLYIANAAIGCNPGEYSTALLCDNTNTESRLNIEDAIFSYTGSSTTHGGALINIQTDVYTLFDNNCTLDPSQINQAPYPPALKVSNADVLMNNCYSKGHILIDSGGVTMNNLTLTVQDPDASAVDIAIAGYAYLSGAMKLATGTTSQYAVTGTGLFGYGVTQYLGAAEPYAPTLSIGQGGLTLPVVDGAQIIKYRPENTNWNVRSVKEALDDLVDLTGVPSETYVKYVHQGESIQDAIDELAALPQPPWKSGQAFVLIGPGIYEENLVMKPYIHLVSLSSGLNNYTVHIKGHINVDLDDGTTDQKLTSLVGLYVSRTQNDISNDPIIHFTGSTDQRLYIKNCAFTVGNRSSYTGILVDNTNTESRLNLYNTILSMNPVTDYPDPEAALLKITTNIYTIVEDNVNFECSKAPGTLAISLDGGSFTTIIGCTINGSVKINGTGTGGGIARCALQVNADDVTPVTIGPGSALGITNTTIAVPLTSTIAYAVDGPVPNAAIFGRGLINYYGHVEPYNPNFNFSGGPIEPPTVDGAGIIRYAPEDTNWVVKTVKEALDDLRTNGGGGAPAAHRDTHEAGGSDIVRLDHITYDNSSSGLTATNPQAAIDELAANSGDRYEMQFDSGDLSSNQLTIPHGLQYQYPIITIVSDTKKQVIPSDVSYTSVNATVVDLTGITITSGWVAIARK